MINNMRGENLINKKALETYIAHELIKNNMASLADDPEYINSLLRALTVKTKKHFILRLFNQPHTNNKNFIIMNGDNNKGKYINSVAVSIGPKLSE